MGNPTVTPITEQRHAGGFIVFPSSGHRSFDRAQLTGAVKIIAGTVLGKLTSGTATSAAKAGNTGNGAMGAVTVSAGAKPGAYTLTLIEPAANAGAYIVEDPEGVNIGSGTVAVAFAAGGLAFTLADGATDFVAGDQFTITVVPDASKYAPLDLTATNGRAFAAAIAYQTVDVTTADKYDTVVTRDIEVNGLELIWPAGITAPQIKSATAQLAQAGILIR